MSSLVTILLHGTKCAIFVNWSTTIEMESKNLEVGRSTMKSMEIDVRGFSRIGSGCSNPYSQCLRILEQD